VTPFDADIKRSNAIFAYVLVILSLQIFLLVVTLEAFQADEEALAWPAAGLSLVLFGTTVALAKLLRRG
jgi:uncharacterized membrane protein (DUF485 family)